MKIALITSYFESPLHTNRAPYNEQLFLKLKQYVDLEIIRPISWVDVVRAKLSGRRFNLDNTYWNGVSISYPVFYFMPKFGHRFSGAMYHWSIKSSVDRLEKAPDMIFSSWAYPDGYAAMQVAKKNNIPLVISVLGSDLNVLPGNAVMRKKIIEVLSYATAIFSPSNALSRVACGLGIDASKVHTVYSGIDDKKFYPEDRAVCEARLKLEPAKKRVVYVGNFKVSKGVIDFVKGLARVAHRRRDFEALLIGKGEDESLVKTTITQFGLDDVVKVVGEINHHELNVWLNASDCLCLPSYAEGLPNVVLEALKTGTKVVATHVGGIPEAVENSAQCLVKPGDIASLSDRLYDALFDDAYITIAGFEIGTYENMASNVLEIIERVANRQ